MVSAEDRDGRIGEVGAEVFLAQGVRQMRRDVLRRRARRARQREGDGCQLGQPAGVVRAGFPDGVHHGETFRPVLSFRPDNALEPRLRL
jgi:hypothetical protein